VSGTSAFARKTTPWSTKLRNDDWSPFTSFERPPKICVSPCDELMERLARDDRGGEVAEQAVPDGRERVDAVAEVVRGVRDVGS
jgi:hypothetical protein